MSYIGNTPAENYASFLTETFSVSATVNYTLSHAVSNENDIRLVINGVVQQPGSGKAYTASNTTLTLTSATQSGDSMYAVYLGRALQTVNPPNASVGTAQLADSSVTSAKLASGAVANTPAFFAHSASDQGSVGDNSFTKVTLGTEVFDVGSCFASSRFTVPSGEAGKYFLYGSVGCEVGANSDLDQGFSAFYLNNSKYLESGINLNDNPIRFVTSLIHVVLDLSVGDYVELYGKVDHVGASAISFGSSNKCTNFGGYKIIE